MKKIIAVDVGTQSLRSVLYDVDGTQRLCAVRPYAPDFSPGNKVEQDTATWDKALKATLSEVAAAMTPQDMADLLCIAVTSQRASVIPMDKAGAAIHPAYMWQDKRATGETRLIAEKIDPMTLYKESGLRLDPYFSLPKMLYYRGRHQERWERTVKLIGVQDYINFLLTGEYVTDHSQACRTMLLDLKKREWNNKLLNYLDIDRSLLCDLVEPGGVGGKLTAAYARATGLPKGLEVRLCGGDQQCAGLALGLMGTGRVTANTGTGSFVLGSTDEPIFDDEARVLCSCGAIPGTYIVEAGIYASGAMYNWCRRQLYDLIDGQEWTFADINTVVDSVPPGAGGIIVLPHFQGSAAPNWNPLAKGVIYNLSLGTTKAELTRAMLEAIAIEISSNIQLIQADIGEIREVGVAGGLTRFSTYCQMLSDCLDKPVMRHMNPEATLMGCLMSACVACGVYADYDEAGRVLLTGREEVYEPNADNYVIYDKKRSAGRILYNALATGQVYQATQNLLGEDY